MTHGRSCSNESIYVQVSQWHTADQVAMNLIYVQVNKWHTEDRVAMNLIYVQVSQWHTEDRIAMNLIYVQVSQWHTTNFQLCLMIKKVLFKLFKLIGWPSPTYLSRYADIISIYRLIPLINSTFLVWIEHTTTKYTNGRPQISQLFPIASYSLFKFNFTSVSPPA